MEKKYVVRLSQDERDHLNEVIKKLNGSSQKVKRAQILLKADANGPNWTDARIAEAFSCRIKTIENIRRRLVTRGFEQTLNGKKRENPPVEKLLNGMTRRKIQYWVIPPKNDAEFTAAMEEVLETYEKPYDPSAPVICMDEQPVQLIEEIKVPIAATREHAKRVDYEYERAGTANIFMFTEPLAGWREVRVRERKTKIDWAEEMAVLLDGRYKESQKVVLVCDNLNTHTKGAFYEVFEPGARLR